MLPYIHEQFHILVSMKNHTLRYMALLAGICILGLLITQGWWFREAYHLKAQQNSRSISIALQEVANEMLRYRKHEALPDFPVRKINDDYFVVMVNDEIDPTLLEFMLVRSFQKRNLHFDFEYGIYDCSSNRMVDGRYVSAKIGRDIGAATHSFPRIYHENTYFGVYFPHLSGDIIGQLPIWLFSSLVIAFIIVFFLYSLWVMFRQKRLVDVQRDFVNNMTHEFKTPLATLSVSAEVLNRPDIIDHPQRFKQYAAIIQQETNRLKTQIDQLLTVSIFDRPGLRLSFEPLELNSLLTHWIHTFSLKLQPDGGSVNYISSHEEYWIKADRHHLENAVINILDNAVKYSPSPVSITIDLKKMPKKLVLRISDNGPGIPLKERKKVFKKFYRVSNHLIHDVKGFGLGLFYVHQVIRLHKGTITITDHLPKGCCFILQMPLHNE
jgi:two-component system phosphate regulon sensor histidine kinase PhoR